MAHDVFISHSSKDKSTAAAICAFLESRKIRCWIAPRDIQPGANFTEALINAIENSKIMVLVFSAESNFSKHVNKEVQRAFDRGITIIPFRIDDVPMSGTMEFILSDTHWLDALNPPLEQHIEELAETIEAILQREPPDSLDGIVEHGPPETVKKPTLWPIGSIIVIVLVISIYFGFFANRYSKYEQSILASYHSGDYSNARENASILMKKDPDNGLSYLILGNIHLLDEDLRTAESYYKKGISAKRITNDQKAETMMGLGRIASIRGNTAEAIQYYSDSSDLAPDIDRAYVSQAILLNSLGEYDQALDMFNRAGEASQLDPSYIAMAKEVKKKASLQNDTERQKEINTLVSELLERMEETEYPAPSDNWTSPPLTLWMMDLETSGYSLQEGKEQLIHSCVVDNLINNSRAQIVERSLLDKLLEELNLGSSRLADSSTAITLGRIMAARLILSGMVYYSGPTTQVTMRLIETETGQIKGAINEEYKSELSPSEIAQNLAALLAEKMQSLYPLRGIISSIDETSVTLNIGAKQGVQRGQMFRVKDTDFVLKIGSVLPESSSAKQADDTVALHEGAFVEQF